jgi:hypothetical protein
VSFSDNTSERFTATSLDPGVLVHWSITTRQKRVTPTSLDSGFLVCWSATASQTGLLLLAWILDLFCELVSDNNLDKVTAISYVSCFAAGKHSLPKRLRAEPATWGPFAGHCWPVS